MLQTPLSRPASTDLGFFSNTRGRKDVGVSATSNVVVTACATQAVAAFPRRGTLEKKAAATSQKRKANAHPCIVDLPRQVKRLRSSPTSSRTGSRASSPKPRANTKSRGASTSISTSGPCTRLSTPGYIYRGSRSRSTSAFPAPPPARVERFFGTEEDGFPGPGAVSSELVVKDQMRAYKQYFHNPEDPQDKTWEPHPTDYPWAELEYPNSHASERFILLVPRDPDHYNPIHCLERSLYAIIESYCTPAQQSLFGTLPSRDIFSDDDSAQLPSTSPPNSQGSCHSSLTSLSSTCSSPNHLRALQRAIHTRDGPLFTNSLNVINGIIRSLKYPPFSPDTDLFEDSNNILKEAVRGWTSEYLPKIVLMRIMDEIYQRCVGPHIRSLVRYEAFSSSVYGELMPTFVSDIVAATHLSPSSLFLDLGSGVGNVVIQASLQAGCMSFGIELMPGPAQVAREQLEEAKRRCRMWGVSMSEVELEEGDMLQSARVSELVCQADVVLINNKVFKEELNEALRTKFLDLKEGAIVVSLMPLVSSVNARVTERNIDEISAIFDVTEHAYHSGSVSWSSLGGSYYLHRVDREGYADIRQRFESTLKPGGTRRMRK